MMQNIARSAFASRKLIRLPFAGGDLSLIAARPAPPPRDGPDSDAVRRVVDRVWEEKGAGRFDGELLGVADLACDPAAVSLACSTIRYRDYVATDRVIDLYPDYPFPLAVGVHALLLAGDEVVCLRLESGRIALPGGAVDAEDLAACPGNPIRAALNREVKEETAIDLCGRALDITGLYLGGYPTHIIVMVAGDLGGVDLRETLGRFAPADSYDGVRDVETIELSTLLRDLDSLPLVVRAAVQSFLHRRGEARFDTIETEV